VICEVFAQPHFHNVSLIDSNVRLLHLEEVAQLLSQQLKAIQALVIEMQNIREGNMFDIYESDWYFFDEETRLVVA